MTKALRAIVSGVRLVRDPNRLDQVFELADGLGTHRRLAVIVAELRKDPRARAALAAKKRVGVVDLDRLGRLPEGTLGRVFADHLRSNGLDPSALPLLPARDDEEFFRAHLYETHDVWHVVTGFATDVAGELGLQAFYLAQLPGRLPAILVGGGLLNAALRAWDDKDARMTEIVRGWLLGRRAEPFFGVDWASLWATPLDEIRARLGVARDAVGAIVDPA